jgi:transposase
MPTLKNLVIKETIKELKGYQKGCSSAVNKRLLFLITIKQNKVPSISKRVLSKILGIDPNSVTNWKRLYEQHGITGIIGDGRIGFKPSIISKAEHDALEKKLKDPKNGIRGYNELLQWVKVELSKDIKYITLVKYAERHFGTKIKVARKSHAKKDDEAISTFKKTSEKSAKS